MPTHHNLEPDADRLSDEDLKTLGEEWAGEKLNSISTHLLEFIERHRNDIFSMVKGSRTPESLVEAAKQYACKRGFIHLPLDLADQIREINNEIWFSGERGDFNRPKIQEEWTLKHARNWRLWRIKEIIYVIDRRAPEVAMVLSR